MPTETCNCGCESPGVQRVWSPLFRNADLGPVSICEGRADLLAPRAEQQGWWLGDEADRAFDRANVITRTDSNGLYESTLVDLFRFGSHYGGVPLGQELEDSATAIYLRNGAVWVVTNLFAIAIYELGAASRLRLKKSPGSGLQRAVST